MPGLWLNASELYALLVSNQLLSQVQPGLLDSYIAPLRSRIEKLLEHGRLRAREAERRIRILQIGSRTIKLELFGKIATALLERRRLNILYHDRAYDKTTKREISPQRLVYYRSNWYLDAWCHLRSGLRTFSVDRIQPLHSNNERIAKNLSDAELDNQLATSYGIFAGQPGHCAVLHFSPEAAKWVADEHWHPHQKTRILKDGGLELRIPYNNHTELIMDILKYGADVEVLRPQVLRKAVEN